MSEEGSAEPYALRTTPTVRRALAEHLPESVALAAYKFMVGPLVREPHRVGKRLLPPLSDRFSARRGTYRIIYRVDEAHRTVTVVDIGPRCDVYHRYWPIQCDGGAPCWR